MAKTTGSVNYRVGFQVDQSGVNKVRQAFEAISNLQLKNLSGNQLNELKEMGLTLDQLKNKASQYREAFLAAFDSRGNFSYDVFKTNVGGVEKIQEMRKAMTVLGPEGEQALNRMDSAMNKFNLRAERGTDVLGDFGKSVKRIFEYQIITKAMNSLMGSVQSAIHYIKDLDAALTDIKVVTGKSSEEMMAFAKNAQQAAKQLSVSTTEYAKASLIYYQQGLGDQEVNQRTRTTIKASHVTGQDAKQVSQQLTSVWNGYNVALSETEAYVDKLAAVAAHSASNLAELSTGMSKVASTANALGVDIDQLNAQISTIISVTRQAPESVGTALKTIYARITDIKSGMDSETSLGNYTSQMAQMGVNVLDAAGNLRDMGTVIEEVGQKWSGYTREQQIALAQTMAGKRQYNNMIALFDNWGKYQESLNTSQNAAGTLSKQDERYQQSIEAHSQKLSTAGQGLIQNFFDPKQVNQLLDALTGLVTFFDKIVSKVADFNTVLGVGVGLLGKMGVEKGGKLVTSMMGRSQDRNFNNWVIQNKVDQVNRRRQNNYTDEQRKNNPEINKRLSEQDKDWQRTRRMAMNRQRLGYTKQDIDHRTELMTASEEANARLTRAEDQAKKLAESNKTKPGMTQYDNISGTSTNQEVTAAIQARQSARANAMNELMQAKNRVEEVANVEDPKVVGVYAAMSQGASEAEQQIQKMIEAVQKINPDKAAQLREQFEQVKTAAGAAQKAIEGQRQERETQKAEKEGQRDKAKEAKEAAEERLNRAKRRQKAAEDYKKADKKQREAQSAKREAWGIRTEEDHSQESKDLFKEQEDAIRRAEADKKAAREALDGEDPAKVDLAKVQAEIAELQKEYEEKAAALQQLEQNIQALEGDGEQTEAEKGFIAKKDSFFMAVDQAKQEGESQGQDNQQALLDAEKARNDALRAQQELIANDLQTATREYQAAWQDAGNALMAASVAAGGLKRISQIWNDDDLSTGEKVIQILGTMITVLPALGGVIKFASSAYQELSSASDRTSAAMARQAGATGAVAGADGTAAGASGVFTGTQKLQESQTKKTTVATDRLTKSTLAYIAANPLLAIGVALLAVAAGVLFGVLQHNRKEKEKEIATSKQWSEQQKKDAERIKNTKKQLESLAQSFNDLNKQYDQGKTSYTQYIDGLQNLAKTLGVVGAAALAARGDIQGLNRQINNALIQQARDTERRAEIAMSSYSAASVYTQYIDNTGYDKVDVNREGTEFAIADIFANAVNDTNAAAKTNAGIKSALGGTVSYSTIASKLGLNKFRGSGKFSDDLVIKDFKDSVEMYDSITRFLDNASDIELQWFESNQSLTQLYAFLEEATASYRQVRGSAQEVRGTAYLLEAKEKIEEQLRDDSTSEFDYTAIVLQLLRSMFKDRKNAESLGAFTEKEIQQAQALLDKELETYDKAFESKISTGQMAFDNAQAIVRKHAALTNSTLQESQQWFDRNFSDTQVISQINVDTVNYWIDVNAEGQSSADDLVIGGVRLSQILETNTGLSGLAQARERVLLAQGQGNINIKEAITSSYQSLYDLFNDQAREIFGFNTKEEFKRALDAGMISQPALLQMYVKLNKKYENGEINLNSRWAEARLGQTQAAQLRSNINAEYWTTPAFNTKGFIVNAVGQANMGTAEGVNLQKGNQQAYIRIIQTLLSAGLTGQVHSSDSQLLTDLEELGFDSANEKLRKKGSMSAKDLYNLLGLDGSFDEFILKNGNAELSRANLRIANLDYIANLYAAVDQATKDIDSDYLKSFTGQGEDNQVKIAKAQAEIIAKNYSKRASEWDINDFAILGGSYDYEQFLQAPQIERLTKLLQLYQNDLAAGKYEGADLILATQQYKAMVEQLNKIKLNLLNKQVAEQRKEWDALRDSVAQVKNICGSFIQDLNSITFTKLVNLRDQLIKIGVEANRVNDIINRIQGKNDGATTDSQVLAALEAQTIASLIELSSYQEQAKQTTGVMVLADTKSFEDSIKDANGLMNDLKDNGTVTITANTNEYNTQLQNLKNMTTGTLSYFSATQQTILTWTLGVATNHINQVRNKLMSMFAESGFSIRAQTISFDDQGQKKAFLETWGKYYEDSGADNFVHLRADADTTDVEKEIEESLAGINGAQAVYKIAFNVAGMNDQELKTLNELLKNAPGGHEIRIKVDENGASLQTVNSAFTKISEFFKDADGGVRKFEVQVTGTGNIKGFISATEQRLQEFEEYLTKEFGQGMWSGTVQSFTLPSDLTFAQGSAIAPIIVKAMKGHLIELQGEGSYKIADGVTPEDSEAFIKQLSQALGDKQLILEKAYTIEPELKYNKKQAEQASEAFKKFLQGRLAGVTATVTIKDNGSSTTILETLKDANEQLDQLLATLYGDNFRKTVSFKVDDPEAKWFEDIKNELVPGQNGIWTTNPEVTYGRANQIYNLAQQNGAQDLQITVTTQGPQQLNIIRKDNGEGIIPADGDTPQAYLQRLWDEYYLTTKGGNDYERAKYAKKQEYFDALSGAHLIDEEQYNKAEADQRQYQAYLKEGKWEAASQLLKDWNGEEYNPFTDNDAKSEAIQQFTESRTLQSERAMLQALGLTQSPQYSDRYKTLQQMTGLIDGTSLITTSTIYELKNAGATIEDIQKLLSNEQLKEAFINAYGGSADALYNGIAGNFTRAEAQTLYGILLEDQVNAVAEVIDSKNLGLYGSLPASTFAIPTIFDSSYDDYIRALGAGGFYQTYGISVDGKNKTMEEFRQALEFANFSPAAIEKYVHLYYDDSGERKTSINPNATKDEITQFIKSFPLQMLGSFDWMSLLEDFNVSDSNDLRLLNQIFAYLNSQFGDEKQATDTMRAALTKALGQNAASAFFINGSRAGWLDDSVLTPAQQSAAKGYKYTKVDENRLVSTTTTYWPSQQAFDHWDSSSKGTLSASGYTYPISYGQLRGDSTISEDARTFYNSMAERAAQEREYYTKANNIQGWNQWVFDTLTETIDNNYIGQEATQQGFYIVQALLQAFDNPDMIRSYVEGFYENTSEAICRAFGIASPAKTMIPLGEFITKGIIVGMQGGIHQVSSVFEEFNRKIAEEIKNFALKENIKIPVKLDTGEELQVSFQDFYDSEQNEEDGSTTYTPKTPEAVKRMLADKIRAEKGQQIREQIKAEKGQQIRAQARQKIGAGPKGMGIEYIMDQPGIIKVSVDPKISAQIKDEVEAQIDAEVEARIDAEAKTQADSILNSTDATAALAQRYFANGQYYKSSQFTAIQKVIIANAVANAAAQADEGEDWTTNKKLWNSFMNEIESNLNGAVKKVQQVKISIQQQWIDGLSELTSLHDEAAKHLLDIWTTRLDAIAKIIEGRLSGKNILESLGGDQDEIKAIAQDMIRSEKSLDAVWDSLFSRDFEASNYDFSLQGDYQKILDAYRTQSPLLYQNGYAPTTYQGYLDAYNRRQRQITDTVTNALAGNPGVDELTFTLKDGQEVDLAPTLMDAISTITNGAFGKDTTLAVGDEYETNDVNTLIRLAALGLIENPQGGFKVDDKGNYHATVRNNASDLSWLQSIINADDENQLKLLISELTEAVYGPRMGDAAWMQAAANDIAFRASKLMRYQEHLSTVAEAQQGVFSNGMSALQAARTSESPMETLDYAQKQAIRTLLNNAQFKKVIADTKFADKSFDQIISSSEDLTLAMEYAAKAISQYGLQIAKEQAAAAQGFVKRDKDNKYIYEGDFKSVTATQGDEIIWSQGGQQQKQYFLYDGVSFIGSKSADGSLISGESFELTANGTSLDGLTFVADSETAGHYAFNGQTASKEVNQFVIGLLQQGIKVQGYGYDFDKLHDNNIIDDQQYARYVAQNAETARTTQITINGQNLTNMQQGLTALDFIRSNQQDESNAGQWGAYADSVKRYALNNGLVETTEQIDEYLDALREGKTLTEQQKDLNKKLTNSYLNAAKGIQTFTLQQWQAWKASARNHNITKVNDQDLEEFIGTMDEYFRVRDKAITHTIHENGVIELSVDASEIEKLPETVQEMLSTAVEKINNGDPVGAEFVNTLLGIDDDSIAKIDDEEARNKMQAAQEQIANLFDDDLETVANMDVILAADLDASTLTMVAGILANEYDELFAATGKPEHAEQAEKWRAVANGLGGESSFEQGAPKGGGGSGGNNAKARTFIDKDPYHDVNNNIEQLTHSLELLQEQQEKVMGADLTSNLQEQLDIMKKQNEQYQLKLKIAQKVAEQQKEQLNNLLTDTGENGYLAQVLGLEKEDAKNLQKDLEAYFGGQFNLTTNADGYVDVDNLALLEKGWQETLNRLYDDWGGLEMGKDNQTRYDNIVNAIKQYQDYAKKLDETASTMREIEKTLQSQAFSIIDKQVERFKLLSETLQTTAEAYKSFNTYQSTVLSGLSDESQLAAASEIFANMANAVDMNEIEAYSNYLEKLTNVVETLSNGGTDSTYSATVNGKTYSDVQTALNDLNELREKAQDLGTQIRENTVTMLGTWSEQLNAVSEAYSTLTSSMEAVESQLQHERKLIQLLYGEQAYAEQDGYFDKEINQALARLSILNDRRALFAENMLEATQRMNEYEPGTLEYDAFKQAANAAQEEFQSAVSDIASATESTLQLIQEKYTNTIEAAAQTLQNTLTDTLGYEWVTSEWDMLKNNPFNMFDEIDAEFALEKIRNEYESTINSMSNVKIQNELRTLLQSQLGTLEEQGFVAQYNLDYAEKLLAVKKAEAELEDAQANKSTLRLRRDSQGNYVYQYISDEDEILSKQQALRDAQQEFYDWARDSQADYLANMVTEWSSAIDKIKELYSSFTNGKIDKEAFQKQIASIVEAYGVTLEQGMGILGNGELGLDFAVDMDLSALGLSNAANRDGIIQALLGDRESAMQAFIENIKNMDYESIGDLLSGQIVAPMQQALDSVMDMENADSLLSQFLAAAGIDINGLTSGQGSSDVYGLLQTAIDNNTTALDVQTNELVEIKSVMDKYLGLLQEITPGLSHMNENIVNGFSTYFATQKENAAAYTGVAFDTGGYTGSWGSEGKLAMLHQKELILNATDTEKVLDAVRMVRDLEGLSSMEMANHMAMIESSVNVPALAAAASALDQNVHIEASFPNVSSSAEIRAALNNLVSTAAQRAMKKN